MEELITQFAGLGTVGIIGGILFKKFLNDSEADKQYFRDEIKEMREENKKDREMFQTELDKSRSVYISSIDRITSKISVLEGEVKEIKETLTKRED